MTSSTAPSQLYKVARVAMCWVSLLLFLRNLYCLFSIKLSGNKSSMSTPQKHTRRVMLVALLDMLVGVSCFACAPAGTTSNGVGTAGTIAGTLSDANGLYTDYNDPPPGDACETSWSGW